MLDVLERGPEIWQCLTAAFFPVPLESSLQLSGSLLELELPSTSSPGRFGSKEQPSKKHNCLTNLGKVYVALTSLIEEQQTAHRRALDNSYDETSESDGNEDNELNMRSRGFAFHGSTPKLSSGFLDAAQNDDGHSSHFEDFLNLFYVLGFGLLESDQDIRCGTLTIFGTLFRNVPKIFRKGCCDSATSGFVKAFLQSNCDEMLARCLDLGADPQAKESEGVEVLRCYRDLTVLAKKYRIDILTTTIAASLGSVIRDYMSIYAAEVDDSQKRKDVMNMAVGLTNLGNNFDLPKSFKASNRRLNVMTSENYPAGMAAKSCAILLADMLLINSTPVLNSGAITVLMSFTLHCCSQRLTESILSSILYIINFSESRNLLSPILLHSFMSSFTSVPLEGTKIDTSFPISEDSFGSSFELKLQSSKLCLISILSSWSGLLAMGSRNSGNRRSQSHQSGLEVFINALLTGDIHCRTAVMETLYHLLGIDCPRSFEFLSDESRNASGVISVGHYADESGAKYRLDEGFVIAEFEDSRDCFSCVRNAQTSLVFAKTIDLVLSQRIYLLASFIEAGLLTTLQQIQDSIIPPETPKDFRIMERNVRFSAAYILIEICQIYKPLLPTHYSSFFSSMVVKTEEESLANLEHESEDNVENSVSEDLLDLAQDSDITGSTASEDRLKKSDASKGEASVKVMDTIVKWKRQKQSGSSILMPEYQPGSQSSIFMEFLRNDHNTHSVQVDASTVSVPKENSRKLESHIGQLLIESYVLEQDEMQISSKDCDEASYEVPDTSYLNYSKEPKESVLENSIALSPPTALFHGNSPRMSGKYSLTESFFKNPFSGQKVSSGKDFSSENGNLDGLMAAEVATFCKHYNWTIICSCLRHFAYKYETGIATSAARAEAFLKRLTLYFMPSSQLFSAEKYYFNQTDSSTSAEFTAKIEAGTLLFRLLADAYSKSLTSDAKLQSGSNAITQLSRRFAEIARILFLDLVSCLEPEYSGSSISSSNSIRTRSSKASIGSRKISTVFSAPSLPELCAQVYFIFLASLPGTNRQNVLTNFRMLEVFVNILLFGKNEPLCKLILTCVPYNREGLGVSDSCQMIELAVRGSSAKNIQRFAMEFLQVLVGFWRDASRVADWKTHGAAKLGWVIEMLFEGVFNPDNVIRDLALTQLLDISTDNRCLPLLFSNDRHLALLLVPSETTEKEATSDPDIASVRSEETNFKSKPNAESMLCEVIHLKAICLFARYFNCELKLDEDVDNGKREGSMIQGRSSQILDSSNEKQDITVCTDGISVLLEDYEMDGNDSLLHKVVVQTWCGRDMCCRYARHVDSLWNRNFSRHHTTPDGKFVRTSATGVVKKPKTATLPPHMFKELVQSESGADFLFAACRHVIADHIHYLAKLAPSTEQLIRVKAAIWAISQIASTGWGYVKLPVQAVILLVMIAEESEVLSLRGIALTSLSLIGKEALNLLHSIGWSSDKSVPSREMTSTRSALALLEDYNGFQLDAQIEIMCKKFCKQLENARAPKNVKDGRAFTAVLKNSELSNVSTLRKYAIKRQIGSVDNRNYAFKEAIDLQRVDARVAVVLPVQMKRFMNIKNFKTKRAKRSSSSEGHLSEHGSVTSSFSGVERHEATDSMEDRASFEISDPRAASTTVGPDDRSKRFSTGNSTMSSYPATPVNRPRCLTVRNAMDVDEMGVGKRSDSIDGVRFSVDSTYDPPDVRNDRSSSNGSNTDSEWLEKIVILVHEEDNCLQCKCMSSLLALKMTNFSEVSTSLTRLNDYMSREENSIYVPKTYREKFLFWTGQLCSITSKEAAVNMEGFMRRFVYGMLKSALNTNDFDPIELEKYQKSPNYEKIEVPKLLCLYSDCLLVLNQNACSAANRYFVHVLFQPIVNEQLIRLRQSGGNSHR